MATSVKDSHHYQIVQAQLDGLAAKELAKAMQEKLALKRMQGYGGWVNCSEEELIELLKKQLDKTEKIDPVDIANFCAFIHMKRLTKQGGEE